MPRPTIDFGPINDLKWSPGDAYIACGGGDSTVTIYDVRANSRSTILTGHTDSVKSVEWGKDNPKLLHSGGRDGDVITWDLRCTKERRLTQRMTISTHPQIKARGHESSNTRHSITTILQQERTPWHLIIAGSGHG